MYTVFGYTMDCMDFDVKYDSFVLAVRAFKEADRYGCVVFIKRDTVDSCSFVK